MVDPKSNGIISVHMSHVTSDDPATLQRPSTAFSEARHATAGTRVLTNLELTFHRRVMVASVMKTAKTNKPTLPVTHTQPNKTKQAPMRAHTTYFEVYGIRTESGIKNSIGYASSMSSSVSSMSDSNSPPSLQRHKRDILKVAIFLS